MFINLLQFSAALPSVSNEGISGVNDHKLNLLITLPAQYFGQPEKKCNENLPAASGAVFQTITQCKFPDCMTAVERYRSHAATHDKTPTTS